MACWSFAGAFWLVAGLGGFLGRRSRRRFRSRSVTGLRRRPGRGSGRRRLPGSRCRFRCRRRVGRQLLVQRGGRPGRRAWGRQLPDRPGPGRLGCVGYGRVGGGWVDRGWVNRDWVDRGWVDSGWRCGRVHTFRRPVDTTQVGGRLVIGVGPRAVRGVGRCGVAGCSGGRRRLGIAGTAGGVPSGVGRFIGGQIPDQLLPGRCDLIVDGLLGTGRLAREQQERACRDQHAAGLQQRDQPPGQARGRRGADRHRHRGAGRECGPTHPPTADLDCDGQAHDDGQDHRDHRRRPVDGQPAARNVTGRRLRHCPHGRGVYHAFVDSDTSRRSRSTWQLSHLHPFATPDRTRNFSWRMSGPHPSW